MPAPVTLDMAWNGRPRSLAMARKDSTRDASCAASILVATTKTGLAARASLKLASSAVTTSKS